MIYHAESEIKSSLYEFNSKEDLDLIINQFNLQLELKSNIQLNSMDSWWIYGIFTKKFYVVVKGDCANCAWHDRIEFNWHKEPLLFGTGSERRAEERLENYLIFLIDRRW